MHESQKTFRRCLRVSNRRKLLYFYLINEANGQEKKLVFITPTERREFQMRKKNNNKKEKIFNEVSKLGLVHKSTNQIVRNHRTEQNSLNQTNNQTKSINTEESQYHSETQSLWMNQKQVPLLPSKNIYIQERNKEKKHLLLFIHLFPNITIDNQDKRRIGTAPPHKAINRQDGDVSVTPWWKTENNTNETERKRNKRAPCLISETKHSFARKSNRNRNGEEKNERGVGRKRESPPLSDRASNSCFSRFRVSCPFLSHFIRFSPLRLRVGWRQNLESERAFVSLSLSIPRRWFFWGDGDGIWSPAALPPINQTSHLHNFPSQFIVWGHIQPS